MKLESLVLVKNLVIELSADRKMKPCYLGPMVVIRCLRGGAFILAELNRAIWQNKVVAFRVIPYLARREIPYTKEVKWLLDAPEESIHLLFEKTNISELDKLPGIEGITET